MPVVGPDLTDPMMGGVWGVRDNDRAASNERLFCKLSLVAE